MTKQNTSKNGAAATKGAISIRNVTKIYDPEGVNVKAVIIVQWKLPVARSV